MGVEVYLSIDKCPGQVLGVVRRTVFTQLEGKVFTVNG